VADPAVGNQATATPSRIYFHFSSAETETKKRLYCVEHASEIVFDQDRHPLTDFLNSPLVVRVPVP
jgi:hypothetical protein